MSKAKQMCGNQTVPCTSGYCYTATYTFNGTVAVLRNCDDPKDKYCPDADKTCRSLTEKNNLTYCAAACCTTDYCNNYTPSSADGVMATKSILSLMAIAGFFFA